MTRLALAATLTLGACAPATPVTRRHQARQTPTSAPTPVLARPTSVIRAEATPVEAAAPRGTSGATCTASWYAHGLRNPDAYTAASRTLKRGSRARVHHNGRHVDVLINDFGPAEYLARRGRCIDLSRGAFAALAPISVGLIRVRVEVLDG